MSAELDKAIKARWDAKALGVTFPGGLHKDIADEGTDFPYVVFTDLGQARRGASSGGLFIDGEVQVDIYVRQDGVNDPNEALGQYMEALDAALAHAPLPVGNGQTIDFQWQFEQKIGEDDEGIYRGMMQYRWLGKRNVDFNPS